MHDCSYSVLKQDPRKTVLVLNITIHEWTMVQHFSIGPNIARNHIVNPQPDMGSSFLIAVVMYKMMLSQKVAGK